MFRLTSKKRLDEALELVASLQKQVGELTVELKEAQANGEFFLKRSESFKFDRDVLGRRVGKLLACIEVYRNHSVARDPKTGRIMNKVKSAEFFADAIQDEYSKQGLS